MRVATRSYCLIYIMCLQALTIEKQQLLRQMELITFYTDDAEEIVQKYWTLLGEGDDNFKELENLISDSFNGIKDVSLFPRNISKTNNPTTKVIYTKFSKYSGTHNLLCVQKMLNHGLNHGFFLSIFKLIPSPIH